MSIQLRNTITLFTLLLASIGGSSVAFAHGQHVNQKPWQVCKEATLGDDCSYTVDTHEEGKVKLHKGSCQAMSEVLMCVRNQPLETIIVPPTNEKLLETLNQSKNIALK